MFDIHLLKNPRRQKKKFLNTRAVAFQEKSTEIEHILGTVKDNKADIHSGRSFWHLFATTFPFLLSKIIGLRFLGSSGLLIAILVSAKILDPANSLQTGMMLIAAYLLFQCVEAVAAAWARRLQVQAGLGISALFISMVNRKLATIDFTKADDFSSGNLKILVSSDTEVLTDFLVSTLWNGMPAIVCVLVLGPFIILEMGLPGLWALLATFLTIPFLSLMSGYITRYEKRMKSKEDDLATLIGEWVSQIRLIRYLGWQQGFAQKISQILRGWTFEAMQQHFLYILCYGLSFVWWMAPIVLMLWTASLSGRPISLEAVFSVIWMLNHIQGFIKFIPNLVLKYAAAKACIQRLDGFISMPDMDSYFLPDTSGITDTTFLPKRLILEGVTKEYNEKSVFGPENLTFDLETSTSIIGSVGSGKTTLLRILAGDLKPDKGKVFLELKNGDRVNLWHRNVHERFKSFAGFVPQEAYLSNATLAQNIALSDQAQSKDIMNAIYSAGLKADLDEFRDGIDQEIGENGINLSGGQKQRVNLARSFYSKRSFLFLDDPLSAVDSNTENELLNGILQHTGSIVLVSHRLKELIRTDRLLVLEKGRVMEDGCPNLLISQKNSLFNKHLSQDVTHG